MIITIIITELPNGLYRVELEGGTVVSERTESAFYGSARKLLRLGLAHPSDKLELKRRGGTVDMRGIVGEAAKWSVREDAKRGPEIIRYREPSTSRDRLSFVEAPSIVSHDELGFTPTDIELASL